MKQMRQWQKRMYHTRDVIDSWCESEGMEKPEHPEGAAKIPPGLWRSFKAGKFWPLLKSRGHNTVSFNKCNCNTLNTQD